MGKQSTRENKTIYQICREEAGLTRSEASEKMTAVSDSKIEKFEYEMQEPTPYDIIQMADAWHTHNAFFGWRPSNNNDMYRLLAVILLCEELLLIYLVFLPLP